MTYVYAVKSKEASHTTYKWVNKSDLAKSLSLDLA